MSRGHQPYNIHMARAKSVATAFDRLVEQLGKLPGIGNRSAQRIAFHLLRQPKSDADELAAAIRAFKTDLKVCATCGNISESDPCPICADDKRDHGQVLVVEQPSDVVSLEQTGAYNGVYHVLMGRLAPLEDIGPGDLNIERLLDRVRPRKTSPRSTDSGQDEGGGTSRVGGGASRGVTEVIIGTNPTLEGDGTALYLAEELGRLGVRVSRLARGLPSGSQLAGVSKAVLSDAIQGRQAMGR